MFKLCSANEAQRSLRPNKYLVACFIYSFSKYLLFQYCFPPFTRSQIVNDISAKNPGIATRAKKNDA